MNVLIVKLGATGDVVRTTPLLRRLSGSSHMDHSSEECCIAGRSVGQPASFFVGRARTSIRHSLRPGHKSGRHPRGSHVSEECPASRDLRCLHGLVSALALYGQLEVLV